MRDKENMFFELGATENKPSRQADNAQVRVWHNP
jgi:hypothetical protein